jgi:KDO2-lipid IV(A) lauroyltransferase
MKLSLRYRLEVLGFRLLIGTTYVVPRRAMLALGSLLGGLAYRVLARHREIALDNLHRAFGDELDSRRRREIAKECWKHFARVTVDTLYFSRLSLESVRRMVVVEGEEHIRNEMAKGKGLLFCSAHFGHWELAAVAAGFEGVPLAIIARPLSNPGLEPILRSLREVSGNQVIYKRNAVRAILKALKEKMGVAIMIDQDARERGIFVPFFGRLASTTPTLASISVRTGAPIVPATCVPESNGRYRLVIQPAVDTRSSGDTEADILRITTDCTKILEAWVRKRPELWLWMHRRWKTRPTDDASGMSASPAAGQEVPR